MRPRLRSIRRWLGDLPISDPVDLRNAPVLQLLFALVGLIAFANTALYAVSLPSRALPVPIDTWFALVGMLLVGTVSWTSLAMIRFGHLRGAVMVFITALLVCLAAVYSRIGVSNLSNDPLPLLPLGISGLVLGRRALWMVFLALAAICMGSALMDLLRDAGPAHPPAAFALGGLVLVTLGAYLLITLLLDRTVTALRESLAEANRQRRDLELANQQLRHEMAERERAQEQLLHAQKLEVVGRLASGVAHDFDNVINVISGYAQRREQLADRGTDALVKAMGGIEMAARRAHAISRKLLNFSRCDTSQPVLFDVGAALRELQPMVRQLFPSQVRVRMECTDTAMAVRMDRDQLELMVLNIASNARDALAGEGCFTIDCASDATGSLVEIRLRDSGPGIPDDVLPHIFESFYTTKPMGQGTGLGLSVMSDIVSAAGGDISVSTAAGEGTCFLLRLPLAATPLQHTAAVNLASVS